MSDVVIFCGYQNIVATKPAGAYLIANVLRSCGLSVMVINYSLELLKRDKQKFTNLLDKFVTPQTKFVSISNTILTDPNRENKQGYVNTINRILEECRRRSPNVITLMGGSDTTASKGYLDIKVDYAIEGQGEAAVIAVIDHVVNNKPLIVSSTINDTKFVSDKVYGYGTYSTDLHYCFTDHDCVGHNETLPLEIGRGCVFRCSYCNFSLNGKRFDEFNKSKETVYRTLMHNYEKFGVTRYVINDDTINDSLEKAHALEDVISKLPFKFEFGGFFRLELFQKHPEMADIYRRCGLRGANFGIETFNRESGLLVGKGFGDKAKDVLLYLRDSWKDEVSTMGSFIIGLPYDTPEKIKAQFDWIEENNALTYYRAAGLQIREADYFLEDPRMKEYYAFKRLPNSVVYDWTSKMMTRATANKLAAHYNSRCDSYRKTMFSMMDGFRLPVALRYASLQDYLNQPASNYLNFEEQTLRRQMIEFYELAMRTNIDTTDPSTWNFPEIKPQENVFIEKIKATEANAAMTINTVTWTTKTW